MLKSTGKTVEREIPREETVEEHEVRQVHRRDNGVGVGAIEDLDEDEEEMEDEDGLHEQEKPQTMRVLERVASFKDVTVWGHDAVSNNDDDPYIRGIREWVGLAGVVSRIFCACESLDMRRWLTIH